MNKQTPIQRPAGNVTDSLRAGTAIGMEDAAILEFGKTFVAWRQTPASPTTVRDTYYAANAEDWNDLSQAMHAGENIYLSNGDARLATAAFKFFDARGWV